MEQKTNCELHGEILMIMQWNNWVHIILKTNYGKVYIEIPRINCNPKKLYKKDYIRITGTVAKLEDNVSDCKRKIIFSRGVVNKLFGESDTNQRLDYCGDFSVIGYISHFQPCDDEFYRVIVQTEECRDSYSLYVEKDMLDKLLYDFDAIRMIKFSGKISITSHSHYFFDEAVSKIQYFATNVEYI